MSCSRYTRLYSRGSRYVAKIGPYRNELIQFMLLDVDLSHHTWEICFIIKFSLKNSVILLKIFTEYFPLVSHCGSSIVNRVLITFSRVKLRVLEVV